MNITTEHLVDCILQSTETIAVKVDNDDYYARQGDICNHYLEVINPSTLIELLTASVEAKDA
jgi:hypothetical protein